MKALFQRLAGKSRHSGSGNNPVVTLRTHLGTIKLELFPGQAPVTCANFLRYVQEGRYADAHFYRTVTLDNQGATATNIEIIQGGLGFVQHPLRLPPIEHEGTARTGLCHLDGTLSMTRNEQGASSEFFICIGDHPELDEGGIRHGDGRGFAAFGRVVKGMDVVRMIHRMPNKNQMLYGPVKAEVAL
ncbi:MAG: peptidylprolyl isomerase [Phaeodactylibacter sp.]|nr:peptidylprolyl isomerase [Phaeodactylibacter sp.]